MQRICFVGFAFCLFSTFSSFGKDGEIIKFQGTVYVDGKEVKELTIPIKVGSTIDTKAPKSFIVIKAASETTTNTIRFQGGIAKYRVEAKKSVIDLIEGALFAYVKKEAQNTDSQLEVRTKTAVMGVRGTKFFAQEDAKSSYLCVCEGTVHAKQLRKADEVAVSAGFDIHIDANSPLKAPTAATAQMLQMTKDGFAEMGFPVP